MDIYATSIDYDPQAKMTQLFFQTVQNKMHWAAHGHTAAEIVRQRADAARPNLGLTTWKNAPAGPVRRQDVTIAKNYRQWPRVPRTVQVLSGAGGRAFLHGLSVRRAERVERILPLVRNVGVGAVCIAGNYDTAKEKSLLAAWPLPRWPGWVEHVNGPQTEAELAALRRGVQRGSPFGEGAWCDQIVRRLGLESTLRPQGRPKKRENGS
jgi:hypothetical protein